VSGRRILIEPAWPGPEARAGSSIGTGERHGRHGRVLHQKVGVTARPVRVELGIIAHVGDPGQIVEEAGLAGRPSRATARAASDSAEALRSTGLRAASVRAAAVARVSTQAGSSDWGRAGSIGHRPADPPRWRRGGGRPRGPGPRAAPDGCDRAPFLHREGKLKGDDGLGGATPEREGLRPVQVHVAEEPPGTGHPGLTAEHDAGRHLGPTSRGRGRDQPLGSRVPPVYSRSHRASGRG
jgi:hypothetical protein